MAQLGLEQIASPEDAKLDIVFVHGLFGNRQSTWTKNGVFWPDRLLTGDIKNARIFTFGYDADVTKFNWNDEVTTQVMESHAVDLCERLVTLRSKTETADRPLIFVAHSLGGLICAQIIVKGTLVGSNDNPAIIASNTRGMIFLGTPFHGSPVAPFGSVLSSMVNFIWATDSQKVHDLEEKSEKLRILAENFATVLNKRIREGKEIHVTFFHETKKLHKVLVVPELNARVHGYGDHASIDANHETMCKFADEDSPGYKSVLGAIQKASVEPGAKPEETSHGPKIENNNWGEIKNQVLGNQLISGDQVFN